MIQRTEYIESQEDSAISLVDILRFFINNSRFLIVITLGLSTLALTISVLLFKQYQKTLIMAVKPVPVAVSALPGIEAKQAGDIAVAFLNEYYDKIDDIDARANYNQDTEQIELSLRSLDTRYLEGASSQVSQLLETEFQSIVEKSIDNRLFTIDLAIDKQKLLLAQLEKEIAQVPDLDRSGSEKIRPLLRLEELERKRTEVIGTINSLEFDKTYLDPAREKLAQLTPKVISVEILTDSKIEPKPSLLQIAVLAAIASFLVAVFAAILRDQLSLLKYKSSDGETENSLKDDLRLSSHQTQDKNML